MQFDAVHARNDVAHPFASLNSDFEMPQTALFAGAGHDLVARMRNGQQPRSAMVRPMTASFGRPSHWSIS